MFKLQKDLKKGDIIRVEFGDYGNWVTVIVDGIDNDKIFCHYKDGRKEIMCGNSMEKIEVIGEDNGK